MECNAASEPAQSKTEQSRLSHAHAAFCSQHSIPVTYMGSCTPRFDRSCIRRPRIGITPACNGQVLFSRITKRRPQFLQLQSNPLSRHLASRLAADLRNLQAQAARVKEEGGLAFTHYLYGVVHGASYFSHLSPRQKIHHGAC